METIMIICTDEQSTKEKNAKEMCVEEQNALGKILKEQEVSELYKISLSKLQQDRHKNKGIKYFKINRSVFYDQKDVENFFLNHKVDLD